jgi:hypothetical protein
MSDNVNNGSSENRGLSKESYEQMVDYMENILTRQLEKLRKYDIDGALALAEETNELAVRIQNTGVLSRSEFSVERERIRILYREIGLIIASERAEVAEKLKEIRKGIKVLEAYGNNS